MTTRIYWDSEIHPSDPCWVAARGYCQYELLGDVGTDPHAQDAALVAGARTRGCSGPFRIERTAASASTKLCALCRRPIPE